VNRWPDNISLSDINIPNSVKEIGVNAFKETPWFNDKTDEFVIVGDGVLIKCNNDNTSVKIPENVKYISGTYLKKATSVLIPRSVISIGDYAFFGCESLIDIVIPDNLESIGKSAFGGCLNLKKIVIPDNIVEIKESTFLGCINLSSVNLGKGIKSIGVYAFFNCLSLNSIKINGTVEFIDDDSLGWNDGVEFKNRNLTIYGVPGTETERYALTYGFKFAPVGIYTDGDTVKSIEEGATAADIKKALGNVSISDKDGKAIVDTAIVGTGYKVTDGTNTYLIIILGDLNGDGVVDSIDCLLVKKMIIGTGKLEGVYLKAACINGTDTPDSTDYLRIKKHVIGTMSLYE
jgi:hypothetical protein